MVRSVKAKLCFILSAFIVLSFSSCKSGTGESLKPTNPTSAAPTVQPTTEPPTEEPTIAEINKYNHNKIKQNSDKIEVKLDEIVSEKEFKGAVYVKIGNDFEYVETNGFSNKDTHNDNSVNTCFRIGSVTKQFTAAAIMLLQEQGKLKTSDTLDKFYPSYECGEKITVKNLLNMTSGIRDYMCIDDSVDSYFYSETQLEYKVSAENSAQKNKSAILNWIFAQELKFEPGSEYSFSNSNYYILGDIIEKASGVSYEKYIQENILDVLELTSTGFTASDSLAVGYDDITENNWTLYPGVAYSSSGLISSIPDLLLWAEAIAGNTLLSEESMEEMTDAENGCYACGFFIEDNELSQNGRIQKFSSDLVYSKSGEVVFIALSNYASCDAADLYSAFSEALKPYLARA